MTATSSEKTEDNTQQDGSRAIRFDFTFHNGLKIIKHIRVPSGYNATTGIVAMEAEVEQQVVDAEDEKLLGDVEHGTDPVTAIPIHPETDTDTVRQKRFLRKLCRWAMDNQDIKWVRKVLYPVWYEFKFIQTYNATQIKSILDLTTPQYNKFNDRLTEFHNSLSFIDGDGALMEEIE